MIKRLYENNDYNKNDEKIKTLIEQIREENLSALKKEDINALEHIQYETYINLDMYVEALENSGKFNMDNGMYLKSGEEYYSNFYKELNRRNENI